MLEIEELCVTVEAAAARDRAEALLRKIEQSIAGRVAEALSTYDARAGDDAREVFIDSIDVQCEISAAWDPGAIARALAGQVHRRLTEATNRCAVVFRDRPEHVAAFLIALADGVAHRRWWFDSEGLAALSTSNAVRTVILDEGETGVVALARLTAVDARRVIGALNRGDAERVLEWIGRRSARAPAPVALLWRLSNALWHADDEPASWLTALVEAERSHAGSAGAATRSLLGTLCALRATAASAPLSPSDDPRRALAQWCSARGFDAEWTRGLADPDVATIVSDARGAARPAAHEALHFHTQRGGVFVLRVLIARLGWPQAWAQSGQCAAVEDADVLAWWLALRAAAHSAHDRRAACNDPALRALLPGGADAEACARRAAHALRCDARTHRLLGEFAKRLPGCAAATARYLRRNLLALDARVTATGAAIDVALGTAPLDVLLVLAGWKRAECALADGRRLILRGTLD